MWSAAQWKTFYAEERASLGERGLAERLDVAPEADLPRGGALVFPHTKMTATGDLTAAVVKALLGAGVDEVLALGVLHGGREQDAARVERARNGDADARAAMRGVHEATAPLCAEEFSLDGFEALLALASSRAGRKPPRIVARHPFLVGNEVVGLPGLDEVARLAERMPVVATTDPVHHGAGYATPAGARRSEHDASTRAWAQTVIEGQLELLAHGQWTAFQELAATVRSDFRDTGPVLASALRGEAELHGGILELRLVDYAATLAAESPTWVAAPLMRLGH